jgi:hypothetical protein
MDRTRGKLEKLAKQKETTVEQLVIDALQATGGNEFQAALTLGVYPGTIRWHKAKIFTSGVDIKVTEPAAPDARTARGE